MAHHLVLVGFNLTEFTFWRDVCLILDIITIHIHKGNIQLALDMTFGFDFYDILFHENPLFPAKRYYFWYSAIKRVQHIIESCKFETFIRPEDPPLSHLANKCYKLITVCNSITEMRFSSSFRIWSTNHMRHLTEIGREIYRSNLAKTYITYWYSLTVQYIICSSIEKKSSIDAAVHSEHGKVIRCEIWGEIYRSIVWLYYV
jgi:hypothetical protein